MATSMAPPPRLNLKDCHQAFFEAVENLGIAAREADPIFEKTAHLIQIAAAAAMRSKDAVHNHTRRAMAAGATTEEIRHAIILVTSTIGFPNVVAALSWADDVIGDHGGPG